MPSASPQQQTVRHKSKNTLPQIVEQETSATPTSNTGSPSVERRERGKDRDKEEKGKEKEKDKDKEKEKEKDDTSESREQPSRDAFTHKDLRSSHSKKDNKLQKDH